MIVSYLQRLCSKKYEISPWYKIQIVHLVSKFVTRNQNNVNKHVKKLFLLLMREFKRGFCFPSSLGVLQGAPSDSSLQS